MAAVKHHEEKEEEEKRKATDNRKKKDLKTIKVDTLRDNAIEYRFTEEILKERGLTAPIGKMWAQPDSAFPG